MVTLQDTVTEKKELVKTALQYGLLGEHLQEPVNRSRPHSRETGPGEAHGIPHRHCSPQELNSIVSLGRETPQCGASKGSQTQGLRSLTLNICFGHHLSSRPCVLILDPTKPGAGIIGTTAHSFAHQRCFLGLRSEQGGLERGTVPIRKGA